jgi:hypothetical protein
VSRGQAEHRKTCHFGGLPCDTCARVVLRVGPWRDDDAETRNNVCSKLEILGVPTHLKRKSTYENLAQNEKLH